MSARLSRPLSLFLILALFLGWGGSSSRWFDASMPAGLADTLQGRSGPGGMHDVCVTPSSAATAPSTPDDPAPTSHAHQHCADCLVRVSAAPPPRLPAVLGLNPGPAYRLTWIFASQASSGPSSVAHGARAPPAPTV